MAVWVTVRWVPVNSNGIVAKPVGREGEIHLENRENLGYNRKKAKGEVL